MQRLLAKGAPHSPARTDALPKELAAMLEYASGAAFSELSTANLAESGHVSVSTAERLFREYTGMTPLKYITEKRFDKARTLLKNGKNVTEAALESGFCDSSYFILQFASGTVSRRTSSASSCNYVFCAPYGKNLAGVGLPSSSSAMLSASTFQLTKPGFMIGSRVSGL